MYFFWLWYAARRSGFALDGDATDPVAQPVRLAVAVEAVAPTLHLRDEDREEVLASAHLERYGVGEVVLPAGVVPNQLLIVVSGAATLAVEVDGGRIDAGRAEPGEPIGQTALTRERTQVVTVAAEVLTVLVLPLDTIDALIHTRPRLAAEMSESLDMKRKLASEALASPALVRSTFSER